MASSCSYHEPYAGKDYNFKSPPEAPIYRPTEEEFAEGPLEYISRIREDAEKYGVCRIIPPESFKPTFAMNMDKFRFTPRIQRINELEATTRIRLNFMEQITKFWALQGSPLKIPTVEKKALDLFKLHKIVMEEGGFESVVQTRRWQKVAAKMGFSSNAFSRVQTSNALRKHYENLLYPYDVFQSGATVGGLESKLAAINNGSGDGDSKSLQTPLCVGVPRAGHHSTRTRYGNVHHADQKPPPLISPPLSPNSSSELKKLQTYGPGPRMPCATLPLGDENSFTADASGSGGILAVASHSNTASSQASAASGSTPTSTPTKSKRGVVPVLGDGVIKPCVQCDLVKPYSSLLTCEDCDTNFHMNCLIPPLNTLPSGSWRCHRCLAQLVRARPKPYASDFGFVQSQKHYSLQEFGDMADEFKSGYFRMPCNRVSTNMIEKEFWRLTQSLDETVTVEYGADLHTNDYGSGFPTALTKNLSSEDEKYVTSPWNLNNLPILEGSVFKHINQNISGMIVPWAYVGMCFSTFCWHNEDHWTYSINYLHWGEPKTWYGVPGESAELFEKSMKNVAPDLFESQPDLLHQLVTICNPNILMSDGVPIYRTDQHAGEFVVTFPRAYHTGFNQGFNLAEAVNFAPPDWIHIGRTCVNHYSFLHRYPVFSHDELVCKIAAEPDVVDVAIADATHKDMLRMVEIERAQRDSLHEWGVSTSNQVIFELLQDDERLCSHCKTTCFLSALSCSCDTKRIVCIRDRDHACLAKKCSPKDIVFSYRYSTEEIRAMCDRLKSRRATYESWSERVKRALELPEEAMKENIGDRKLTRLRIKNGSVSQITKPEPGSMDSDTEEELDRDEVVKPTLAHLQSLLIEAHSSYYSKTSDSYQELKSVISNAKKCSKVARALLDQHERNLRVEKGREAARKARIKSSETLMSPSKKRASLANGTVNSGSRFMQQPIDPHQSAASKLTLEDLQLFHDEIANQPCTIPETDRIKEMLHNCDELLERFNRMVMKGEYTFVDRNANNICDMDPQSQPHYYASDVEQLIRDMNYMTVVDFARPINQLNYKLGELRWHEEADGILSRYTNLPPPPSDTSLLGCPRRDEFYASLSSDTVKGLIDDGMNLPNMTRVIRSKLVQLQSIVDDLTLWTEAMAQEAERRRIEEERRAQEARIREAAEKKAEAKRKLEAAKKAELAKKHALALKKAARQEEKKRKLAAAEAAREAQLLAANEVKDEPNGQQDVKPGDLTGPAKKKQKKSKKDDDDEFLICVLKEACKKPAKIKGMPDPVEWVGCDTCERWFHQYCVGVSSDEIKEGESWFCADCVAKGSKSSPATSTAQTDPVVSTLKGDAESKPETTLTKIEACDTTREDGTNRPENEDDNDEEEETEEIRDYDDVEVEFSPPAPDLQSHEILADEDDSEAANETQQQHVHVHGNGNSYQDIKPEPQL